VINLLDPLWWNLACCKAFEHDRHVSRHDQQSLNTFLKSGTLIPDLSQQHIVPFYLLEEHCMKSRRVPCFVLHEFCMVEWLWNLLLIPSRSHLQCQRISYLKRWALYGKTFITLHRKYNQQAKMTTAIEGQSVSPCILEEMQQKQ
jgi:hypothetical protein